VPVIWVELFKIYDSIYALEQVKLPTVSQPSYTMGFQNGRERDKGKEGREKEGKKMYVREGTMDQTKRSINKE